MATVKTSLSGERSSSVRANEPGMFDPKSSSQDSRRPCIITHLGLVQLKRIIPGAVPTLHAQTKDLQEAAPICNKDGHGNLEGVTVTSEISPEQRNLPEAAPNCKSSSSGLRKGKKRCFGEISVVANEAPLQMGEDIAELHRKIRNIQCQLDMEKRKKENILREKENILKEKKACEEFVIQLRKELNIAYIKVCANIRRHLCKHSLN
ncbi:hypothetical protein Pcinc_012481 [Petrolisthes cinctipes]|uniref:Uncharacterized protein n=1 Tax=Petrolisthes cinctipes TaxID=88211 RepID=A0AAE1G0K4_PETCI|nr:hypothetical protein Pcinc_012481 [Petrolisthes cinctipes]